MCIKDWRIYILKDKQYEENGHKVLYSVNVCTLVLWCTINLVTLKNSSIVINYTPAYYKWNNFINFFKGSNNPVISWPRKKPLTLECYEALSPSYH